MGILNVTPDSFFDGGKYCDVKSAHKRAVCMQQEGADIIDIGAESTRPGSEPVSVKEELKRVVPVVEALAGKLDIPISVDTRKSEVAAAALKAGASIINDVTGLLGDTNMARVVSAYKAAVVIMHIKGRPKTMQNVPRYLNLLEDIKNTLRKGIKVALENGISKNSVMVDPGIGFGKTISHNLKIINNICKFKTLGYPVVIGLSRKSFIGKILNLQVQERLVPTVAANAVAIIKGADIIRVHDVKEAVWTREILCRINSS